MNNSHIKKHFLRQLFSDGYTRLKCMSESCQALGYDCQFSFRFLQTAYFK